MTKLKLMLCTAMVSTLVLAGCQQTAKSQNENMIIGSCGTKSVKPISAGTLSPQEKTDVCRVMVASLRRNPPVYLLKDLYHLVSMVKQTASDDSATVIASKAMSIVVTRHQTNNNEAIQNTFGTIWQIYQGTQTQVTFSELNMKLRQAEASQQPLTDEGLVKVGIMLWHNKQLQNGTGKDHFNQG